MAKPVPIWAAVRRPSRSSTGKADRPPERQDRGDDLQGRGAGRSEGAICPEKKSTAMKWIWLMAVTRVVQKAARATVQSTRKRTRKARTSAGTKAAAAAQA